MKLNYPVICLLSMVISLTGCQNKQNNTTNNELLEINETDYVINYTSDLVMYRTGEHHNAFTLFTNKEDEKDSFIDYLELKIENLEKYKMDLDYFVQLREYTHKSKGKLILSERRKGKDTEYQKFIYEGMAKDMELCYLEYAFFNYHFSYVLTFHCEKLKFEKYRVKMEKIMDSFKLK